MLIAQETINFDGMFVETMPTRNMGWQTHTEREGKNGMTWHDSHIVQDYFRQTIQPPQQQQPIRVSRGRAEGTLTLQREKERKDRLSPQRESGGRDLIFLSACLSR